MDFIKEIIKKASTSIPKTESAYGSFVNAAIDLATLEGNYVRHPQHTTPEIVVNRMRVLAKNIGLTKVEEYLSTYKTEHFYIDQLEFDSFIKLACDIIKLHVVNDHFSKVDLMLILNLDSEIKQA